MSPITERLFSLRDETYAAFMRRLLPELPAESVIGVRTPVLRKLASELHGGAEAEGFLSELPHTYFEENQLHSFLISKEKNFDKCVPKVEAFLPYVDNWATCDQLSPSCFKKHRGELLSLIDSWLASDHVFTVRFGIEMLMNHFLDGDFKKEQIAKVTALRSEAYYLNMMIAWYMATALAKQWDAAISYLETQTMDVWTHNKTIQKAIESDRISEEQKNYLRTLKKKN